MQFYSKREYLQLLSFTLFGVITVFNPTIVLTLKLLFVLTFIPVFYFTMTIHTATIKKDSIQYLKKFFSFTISQRVIPVESIEKIEKIRYTMKLHCKNGKNIHFVMHSPEFISAIEKFCAQHNISIVKKESKKNA